MLAAFHNCVAVVVPRGVLGNGIVCSVTPWPAKCTGHGKKATDWPPTRLRFEQSSKPAHGSRTVADGAATLPIALAHVGRVHAKIEDLEFLEERASLRALIIFPKDVDADNRAIWRSAAMALEDCGEFDSAQPGQELRFTAEFLSALKDQLLLAGKMLSRAAERYGVCVQVGRCLRSLLGLDQGGIGDMPVPGSISLAMALHARPVDMGPTRSHFKDGGVRNELEGVSNHYKNWRAFVSVAHFCAAHLEFRRHDLTGWPGAVALPCDATCFQRFLRRAEELRLAACARDILNADRMRKLDHDFIRELQRQR